MPYFENSMPKKIFLFFSVFLVAFAFLFFVVRPFSTGLVVIGGSASFAAAVPELLWLHFDDTPTDGVLDSSIGIHNGTCTASCPTYLPSGGFDGRGAYQFVAGQGLTVANEPVFDLERSQAFSVSVWILRSAQGKYQAIVSKGISGPAYRGFSFSLDGTSGTHLMLSLISDFASSPKNQLVVTGSTTLTDGAWHHVAVTYDGSSTPAGVKLFVGGVQETVTSTGTLSGTLLTDFPLQVGASQDSGDSWVGSLDEIGIYNRALSLSEIQTLAQKSTPTCGNAIIEGTEQCDGTNLNNKTCIALGFTGGTLTCTASCTFNTSQCTVPVPDTISPTAPASLTATTVSSTQINLAWTASTDNVAVTGYKVFRNGAQVGASATNTFQDTGLSPSTTYTYTASAYDAAGNNSTQSANASGTTQSAPPQGTMTTASTVNCVSPCPVFFDATPSSSGVVQPTQSLNSVPTYTNLDYTWDFGDPASGNWAWGQQTIDPTYNSRNKASGFEAAHVFELPDVGNDGAPDVPNKTYTVSLQVKQNEVTTSYTQNIVVRAPSHIYYVNAVTGNDLNPGTMAQPFQTISKGIAMLGVDDKVVLARGQSFSLMSSMPDHTTLGAYGTCTFSVGSPVCTNAPTLTGTLNLVGTLTGVVGLSGSTGVKFVDIHFVPNADYFLVAGSQSITDFLLLRSQIDNAGIYSGYQLDGFFVMDSQTNNAPQFVLLTGYQSVFPFTSRKVALLGNHFDHSTQQMLYIGAFDRAVVSHNWLYRRSLPYGDAGSWGKPLFRLGANQANTYKVVIVDNVIDNSNNYEALDLAASTGNSGTTLEITNNKQAQNVLVERNEITDADGQHGVVLMYLAKDRLITTLRNNILHYNPATTDAEFQIDSLSSYGAPNGVWFYNNTVYTGGFGWFRNDPAAQNVYVYNNTVDSTCVTVTTALPAGATAGCTSGAPSCVENWSCTAWSTCSSGTQTRTCTDSNNCGTTNNKPPTTQSCTVPQCSVAADCAAQQCKTSACVSGQCVYSNVSNGSTCSDGRYCNGFETCQSETCAAGTPVVCSPDSVACTAETCSDALGSCVSIPNSSLCNDNVSCTVDSCDVSLGCVSVPDNLACNDQIACTADTCNRVAGCINDSSACVACTLTGVAWSTGSVQNGQPVTITVNSTGCFLGEIVDLELWESDGSNGSSRVTSVTLPSITLNGATGSITWNAVWTKDTGDPSGLPGNPYDPEYYVKAILHSNTTMTVVTPNNLTVTNPDMDSDGTPNNTDCNDFNTTIGQCTGCSICSDPLGYNGTCTANNSACTPITCIPVCDYWTCTGTQIPVFNSSTEPGVCTVSGNSGTCLQSTCQNYTCQTSATCNPNLDSDGDGVPDDRDKCPGTLPGTRVNAKGCPLPKSGKFSSASTTDFYNADLSNITDLTLGIDGIGIFFLTAQPL